MNILISFLSSKIINKYLLKLNFIAGLLFSANLLADQICIEADVSGSVTTTNINATVQSGSIHLILTDPETNVILFEQWGGVLGKITAQNDTGGTTLNHIIFFDEGNTIKTREDQAQILFPINEYECAFQVTETISQFKGTNQLKNLSGEMYADGVVSFCPGDNNNSFELSGTVCFK